MSRDRTRTSSMCKSRPDRLVRRLPRAAPTRTRAPKPRLQVPRRLPLLVVQHQQGALAEPLRSKLPPAEVEAVDGAVVTTGATTQVLVEGSGVAANRALCRRSIPREV